jgi:hypothetical protein
MLDRHVSRHLVRSADSRGLEAGYRMRASWRETGCLEMLMDRVPVLMARAPACRDRR